MGAFRQCYRGIAAQQCPKLSGKKRSILFAALHTICIGTAASAFSVDDNLLQKSASYRIFDEIGPELYGFTDTVGAGLRLWGPDGCR